MLVFFIHGVATRDVKYSDNLQTLIRQEFNKKNQIRPYFHACFWGDILKSSDKIWRGIDNSLALFQTENPQVDINNCFRYQEIREGFLTEFFGDVLTYFNPEKGKKIRKLIADQLEEYIEEYPHEKELHIVAHSLGTVILWDILFSDHFNSDDPAFKIKNLINNLEENKRIQVKSITTLGSPILFFTMMLNTNYDKIKEIITQINLKSWLNILHCSDLVAYPLQDIFHNLNSEFFMRDKYIDNDANLAEKTAYNLGQMHAASALGVTDAHISYWQNSFTAQIITNNILGDFDSLKQPLNNNNKNFFGF